MSRYNLLLPYLTYPILSYSTLLNPLPLFFSTSIINGTVAKVDPSHTLVSL